MFSNYHLFLSQSENGPRHIEVLYVKTISNYDLEISNIYKCLCTKIRIKITPKPKKVKDNPGFKPVHKRWIIERTNAWLEKYRSLWKNCEYYISTSITKIRLCTIRLQIRLLARGSN